MMTLAMSSLLVLVGVFGVGKVNTSGAPANVAPLVVEVDAGHLQLTPADQESVFRTVAPFRVHAGSILPRWRVVAQAGPISEPRGGNARRKLNPPRISLIPARAIDNPGQAWTGKTVPLDGTTVIAAGGQTGGRILEINTFDLLVEVDPMSAPGQYQGSLRIVPEMPGGNDAPAPMSVDFEWNVVELLAVDVNSEEMSFGNTGPGEHDCLAPVTLTIHSNHYEAELVIVMEPLVGVDHDASLPPDSSCLGWGDNPAAAENSANNVPWGHNDVRIVVGPGSHKIAIHGRINLSMSQTAGRYSGRIVITSRVIN